MSAVKKASKLSPKQAAADRANLAKARAALKGRTRTAKQVAASRANLAKARAAQKARSAGKSSVAAKTAKKPQAPRPDFQRDPDSGALVPAETAFSLDLHRLPVCAASAAAEHLACYTGITVPDEAVLLLHNLVRPARIADLLEYLAADGFPGTGERLAHFERCDPDADAPGLVYGVQLGRGSYHAVMSYPGAMASWGMLLARAGIPEEAWWLEWESE